MSDLLHLMPYLTASLRHAQESLAPLLDFFLHSPYQEKQSDPDACVFAFGNPQSMPLEGFTKALQKAIVPQNKDWFAYKQSEPAAQEAVAASLHARLGIAFEPDDIALTTGAFAGLMLLCHMLTEPGDEIIYNMPGWFFYESTIAHSRATPVCVRTQPSTFDLDLDAIAAAITPRTRAVIVNSPNNPSGRIYPPAALERLAAILEEAGARYGRTVYLISDEAYSQILLNGAQFTSPTAYYPHSFLVYTWGKVLLTPGQRIGFIALPPQMPHREQMRQMLLLAQMTLGWAYPNALLQHALPDLLHLSIDIPALERRIARMYGALTEMGYEVLRPEGTFYMNFVSPIEDDVEFSRRLMERNVLALPGRVMEMPGYLRLSMTAGEEMVERSLPRFRAALETA